MGQKTSFERALEIYNHLNAALEPVDQADGSYRHNPGFSSHINYDAPSQSYDNPTQNYHAPSTGYGNELSGYGDEGEVDLAPLSYIPTLIIVLLGIVIRRMVSC